MERDLRCGKNEKVDVFTRIVEQLLNEGGDVKQRMHDLLSLCITDNPTPPQEMHNQYLRMRSDTLVDCMLGVQDIHIGWSQLNGGRPRPMPAPLKAALDNAVLETSMTMAACWPTITADIYRRFMQNRERKD